MLPTKAEWFVESQDGKFLKVGVSTVNEFDLINFRRFPDSATDEDGLLLKLLRLETTFEVLSSCELVTVDVLSAAVEVSSSPSRPLLVGSKILEQDTRKRDKSVDPVDSREIGSSLNKDGEICDGLVV